MRKFLIFGLLLIPVSCASVKQQHPASFNHHKYVNAGIGFSLIFKSPWQVYTSPENASPGLRRIFSVIRQQNQQVLYVGLYDDMKALAYATSSRPSINLDFYVSVLLALAHNSMGPVISKQKETINAIPMIKIEYFGKLENSRAIFLEYFFDVGKTRLRVAFGADYEIFENLRKEFEAVIESIQIR
jgi:hypothetical protein